MGSGIAVPIIAVTIIAVTIIAVPITCRTHGTH